MKKTEIKEFVEKVAMVIISIAGVCNWAILSPAIKLLVIICTIGTLLMLLEKSIDKIFAINDFRKICKNIPELERKLRKVQMYEYSRGKEFAKEFSKKERVLCERNIKTLEFLKKDVRTSYCKNILDKKIVQIENIQNQMVILR